MMFYSVSFQLQTSHRPYSCVRGEISLGVRTELRTDKEYMIVLLVVSFYDVSTLFMSFNAELNFKQFSLIKI